MTIPIWFVFLHGAGFLALFMWPQMLQEDTLFQLELTTAGVFGIIIFVMTLLLIYKFVDSKYEIKKKGVRND